MMTVGTLPPELESALYWQGKLLDRNGQTIVPNQPYEVMKEKRIKLRLMKSEMEKVAKVMQADIIQNYETIRKIKTELFQDIEQLKQEASNCPR